VKEKGTSFSKFLARGSIGKSRRHMKDDALTNILRRPSFRGNFDFM
jgi:hypothetical protein